jgi:hypothetical protein
VDREENQSDIPMLLLYLHFLPEEAIKIPFQKGFNAEFERILTKEGYIDEQKLAERKEKDKHQHSQQVKL